MKVDLSCPIELWEYALPTPEQAACSFTFYNLEQKTISSVQLSATCFSADGEVVKTLVERPMALAAQGKEQFSALLPVEAELEVTEVSLSVDKVWFEDGTVWRRASSARLMDYEPNELPQGRALEQLRYVAGADAVGYPVDQGLVWLCVCGRVNAAGEPVCRRCGRSQEHVFARFQKEAVEEAIAQRELQLEDKARVAREEASRQEFIRQERLRRKRRARRARTIALVSSIFLVAAVYFFIVFGIPEIRYQQAAAALSEGSYATARTAFANLQDYRNAADMLKACDFAQAGSLLETGTMQTVDQAITLLTDLGDYEGAEKQLTQANYQKGALLVERASYDEASEILRPLGNYKDAPLLLRKSEYQIAKREMSQGAYEAAGARLRAIGDYEDAITLAQECVYNPAVLALASQEYLKAAEMFASIPGYQDADTRYQDSIYQAAIALRTGGNPEEAAGYFQQLGDYRGAAQEASESYYQAGVKARDASDFEKARTLFSKIPEYKDATVQVNACTYQPAKLSMAAGNYQEAAALFATLPSYLDSAELYQQCTYLPGQQALKDGRYEQAIELLGAIPEYKDASKLIQQAKYAIADGLYKEGKLEEAAVKFAELEKYTDSETRAQQAKYDFAMQAYTAQDYTVASTRFEALGKFSDARKMVTECARALAKELYDAGDKQGAYEAYLAIADDDAAKQSAYACAYEMADEKRDAGDLVEASELYALAKNYSDAAEKRNQCIYTHAKGLMQQQRYPEASTFFDSILDYQDAKALRNECYDSWLAATLTEAQRLSDAGEYKQTIDLLKGENLEGLPKKYSGLKTLYQDANLRFARELIKENKALEAYPFLLEAGNYKDAKTQLEKKIYQLLGVWETKDGLKYTFNMDYTCEVAGQTLVFNVVDYSVLTGATKEELAPTFHIGTLGTKSMSLRDNEDELIRLTRVADVKLLDVSADAPENAAPASTQDESDAVDG